MIYLADHLCGTLRAFKYPVGIVLICDRLILTDTLHDALSKVSAELNPWTRPVGHLVLLICTPVSPPLT